jgi:DNA-directed RNA polymerase subunit H (RpoH/RPB5)
MLTPEKVKSMCKKFQVSLADFPKLSADDTMARYFGMKPKDVTQCIRKNGIYYRVVV